MNLIRKEIYLHKTEKQKERRELLGALSVIMLLLPETLRYLPLETLLIEHLAFVLWGARHADGYLQERSLRNVRTEAHHASFPTL